MVQNDISLLLSNTLHYFLQSYPYVSEFPYICLIKSYQVMKLNRIKTVLSEKGISQTWLAKQLDKSFSMVNAYACNRIQPNLETLQRIAEILQVDLKDLITDKKERLQ